MGGGGGGGGETKGASFQDGKTSREVSSGTLLSECSQEAQGHRSLDPHRSLSPEPSTPGPSSS